MFADHRPTVTTRAQRVLVRFSCAASSVEATVVKLFPLLSSLRIAVQRRILVDRNRLYPVCFGSFYLPQLGVIGGLVVLCLPYEHPSLALMYSCLCVALNRKYVIVNMLKEILISSLKLTCSLFML